MYRSTCYYFTYIFIALFALFTSLSVCAENFSKETSIYASSIKWDDENSRQKLLETVPQWHDDIIKALFKAYLNPQQYGLPKSSNLQTYNVTFINAFWGPLNNPFNKFPRPAKSFLFFNISYNSKVDFMMVPLIKNLADGNYYIFDKDHKRPMLLTSWVNEIKSAKNLESPIRFNICNGYGNFPDDSCISKGYAAEAQDTQASITKTDLALKNKDNSAHRDFNEDWQTKIKKMENADTIYDSSISWNKVEARNKLLNKVVAWRSYKTIENQFKQIRDIRYFNDPEYSDFQRRISWLYPDDGCWTRATAVIRDLFGPFNNKNNISPRPSKVFAFGNLCANTPNSPDGLVTWWYHTAPIVKDKVTNQTYVLDPSINPYQPITMEKWVEEISSQSGTCANSNASVNKFNICNGYGTGPFDTCKNSYITETSSMLTQSSYQIEERYRQEELGRDANAVLGDSPPWIN